MCAVEVGPAHRGLDRMNLLQFHLGIQICKSWGLDIWHGFGAYQGLDLLGAIEGKPQAHLATPDMQGMSQIEDGHLNGKLIYDPIKGQRAAGLRILPATHGCISVPSHICVSIA